VVPYATDGVVKGVILDLDGVLWIGGALSPRAPMFLEALRQRQLAFCILTNDCTASADQRRMELVRAGLNIDSHQLVTATQVAREWLLKRGYRRILYLGREEAALDLNPLQRVRSSRVDAVVVGDLFSCYEKSLLALAVEAISSGAKFVAMQRKRLWSDGVATHVDNGFWVAGLEYVSRQRAIVVGKPARGAYQLAIQRLGLQLAHRSSVVMMSDDADEDLAGADRCGLRTILIGAGAHPAHQCAQTIDGALSYLPSHA